MALLCVVEIVEITVFVIVGVVVVDVVEAAAAGGGGGSGVCIWVRYGRRKNGSRPPSTVVAASSRILRSHHFCMRYTCTTYTCVVSCKHYCMRCMRLT